MLVNLTNSYEKQEIMPELIELAKFAKHHIPQEHELDDQDFIDKRIWVTFSSWHLDKSICENKFSYKRISLYSNVCVRP